MRGPACLLSLALLLVLGADRTSSFLSPALPFRRPGRAQGAPPALRPAPPYCPTDAWGPCLRRGGAWWVPCMASAAGEGAKKRPNVAVHVTRSAETAQRKRHPWLFENEIRKVSREGEAGDVAVVFDSKDQLVSLGLIDPYSPIRVRVLQHNEKCTIDAEFMAQRVLAAVEKRKTIVPPGTDGFRVINGENDGMSGVVADMYAGTLVLKLYSSAWLPWTAALTAPLTQAFAPTRIVLLLSRQIQKIPKESVGKFHNGMVLSGAPLLGAVVFRESGLRFEADPINGQKTGFFLDQRDNRRAVEKLAAGKSVLNVFSYTGGFSLYAARGGARAVTSVDISEPAMEAARRNFALNAGEYASVRDCVHNCVVADAFEFMKEAVRSGETYDVVIVDPPSFANKASLREVAIRRYAELAGLAVKLVRRGGTVALASCSSRVSAEQFWATCQEAARASGRPLTGAITTEHAEDHPVTFAQGSYLKCLFAKVP